MKHFTIFLTLLLLAGCTPGAPAVEDQGTSPGVSLPQASITEDGHFSLSKDALGKEFLLQASFIDQQGSRLLGSPTSIGIQSRIISFLKQKDFLFMMESTQGLLTSDELPAERVLTAFKIVEDKDDKIVFDFNEGMRKIFMVREWYASDFDWGLPLQRTLSVSHSFLKDVQLLKTKILIRQIAQVEASSFGRGFVFPVEVVYYLEPYQSNPDFKPVVNEGFDRVGFFETQPTLRKEFGNLQNYIAKWDGNKPIVFHVSSNTPEEFQQAVTEGILYWNKAFGKEIVQALIGPKGVTAPHPDYNIVQWVTNDNARIAYADMQMDPRTGEILHAQIYFSTSWTVRPLDKLQRKFKVSGPPQKENQEEEKMGWMGLKGFSPGLLCQYPFFEDFSNFMIGARNYPENVLKLSQDVVREIIAHEVGHTLGLRHNFAASTGSALKPSQISQMFDDYLQTGEWKDNKHVASSVMDYLPLSTTVLNGAFIGRKESGPLLYDAMAISWGYFGSLLEDDLTKVLYCPDSLADGYVDCQREDGAFHPVLDLANKFERKVRNVSKEIAEEYLFAKAFYDPQKRSSLEEVALDASSFAYFIVNSLTYFVDLLRGDFESLYLKRTFPPVTDINEEEFEGVKLAWLNRGISGGGGIQTLLNLIAGEGVWDLLQGYRMDFEAILDHPHFKEGTTFRGEPYRFTDEEIAKIKKVAKRFFKILPEKVMKNITETLAGPKFMDIPYDHVVMRPSRGRPYYPTRTRAFRPIQDLDGLETVLGNWAEFVIVTGAEKEPLFDGGHRLMAVEILSPAQGPRKNWHLNNREGIAQTLLSKIEQRFGARFEDIDPNTLDEKQRKAFEVELKIFKALATFGLKTALQIDPESPPH